MSASDWMMLLAVLIGPILAVQAQKYLEFLRERRVAKVRIFDALMATRAARTSMAHVEALNRIDLEYQGRRVMGRLKQSEGERQVSHAWKLYRDHLNRTFKPEELDNWGDKGTELFIDLLYKMGNGLGYDFDKVELNKGAYSPVAHGQEENYQRFAKTWFVNLAHGKIAIPIRILDEDLTEEPKQEVKGNSEAVRV